MSKYIGNDVSLIISSIRDKMKTAGRDLRAVYFVACGGSESNMNAGRYLLDTESVGLSVKKYNSNEFVHATPRKLDGDCIVIACSKGGTAETVAALKHAQDAGAHVIGITGSETSPTAQACNDYAMLYKTSESGVFDQSSSAHALRLGFEILHQFEHFERYEEARRGFEKLAEITIDARKRYTERAVMFANRCRDDKMFYVLGCGPLLGTAYSLTFCHLIEMQNLHATLVPSGDYFHGPFETTTPDLAMILLMSGGKVRPLDERVLRFLEKHAGHHFVIDARETQLWNAVDPSVAEYFEPSVIWDVERLFVEQLAALRKRSMDDRVYMWKFPY